MQLAYYLFLINDFEAAIFFLHEQLKLTENQSEILLNLGVLYGRINKHHEAIEYAHKAYDIDNKNFVALDTLAKSYSEINNNELSKKYGTLSLSIKDLIYGRIDDTTFKLRQQDKAYFLSSKNIDVVAFSLFGDDPRYLRGALQNMLMQPLIYENWTFRFYIDSSVPIEFQKLLGSLGAELIIEKDSDTLLEKLCWRFKVASDQKVRFFLVRDVDSVVSKREMLAVKQWINSDKLFHVLRDWWTHTDLILAGMWGGTANLLPNISDMLRKYKPRTAVTPHIDQEFLRDEIWKIIKQSCLIHDRCFSFSNPLPFLDEPINNIEHVGQNEYSINHEKQTIILKKYIDSYKCLQQKINS
jgi:hypothetical protein